MGSNKKDKKVKKGSKKDEQMEDITEEDPEFFNFLKEHDKELLEFDEETDPLDHLLARPRLLPTNNNEF
nr:nucleolar complex protein 2 homolog [Tanacetum cinerariifolium]